MSTSHTMNKPDFIIIGAMKSATSSLQDQLSLLPGVFMTTPKEPNFFSNDEIYARGESWYSALYDDAQLNDLKGEASTHYTKLPKHPQTISRLSGYCPHAKFIYVMRHPVDRLLSHFVHNWSMGFIPKSASIDEMIDSYPPLIEYSLYSKQIRPWLEQFGKECVLPVFFNRIVSTPQLEFERICSFIGYLGQVTWRDDLEAKNVSSRRRRRIPLHNILIDSKFAESLRRALVPKLIRNAVRERLPTLKKPALSHERMLALEEIFDKDLAVLGELFGVKLNCQNFKEITADTCLDWA